MPSASSRAVPDGARGARRVDDVVVAEAVATAVDLARVLLSPTTLLDDDDDDDDEGDCEDENICRS